MAGDFDKRRRGLLGSAPRRPRMRLGGCLLWLLGLLIVLIILSLLFGGFQKGTKVSGTGPPLAKPCQRMALGGPGVVPRTAQLLQVSSVT